jgi:hypothetical protein
MLIDDVLPEFDVTRVESTVVSAPPDVVYRVALDLDMVQMARDDALVGFLFAVRGLPDQVLHLLGRRPAPEPPASMRLADLPSEGEWARLAEDPGREIVFGAVGRFWNGPIEWRTTSAETFASVTDPDTARIAANLAVLPYSGGRVLLTYETRTAATDESARQGVERYWRFLSPFVGIVLRAVLRDIRRRAESLASDTP